MHIPFIATVELTALSRPAPEPGLVFSCRDDQGQLVARTVATLDDAEQYAFAILSVVAAGRANDPKVTPFGRSPRTQARLMRRQGTAPAAPIYAGQPSPGASLPLPGAQA